MSVNVPGSSYPLPVTLTVPDYVVTRKRVKNVRLVVKAPTGEVRVTAPFHVPDREIEEFVKSKARWIARHQDRIALQPAPLEPGPEANRLRRELKRVLPPLLAEWAPRLGVPVPDFTVRRMTTRWGTCNTRACRITVNLELARREPELLEYVVVHELAHLIEKGHGPRFKAVMDRHLPGWKLYRKALNHGGVAVD
jgi:predicted metal-dependent hydrolase